MKKGKMQLNELKVKSFVTEVDKKNVKGGADIQTLDLTFCTRASCGIRACTENILHCF
jgi:molybdate-binding protein